MQLMKHQVEALNETKQFNKCAYYYDMGLGKTFIGSEKAMSFGKHTLVICQKSKVDDWLEHFSKNYDVHALNLTNKKTFQCFMEWTTKRIIYEKPVVGVINYELAWRRRELMKLEDFTLVLDESSLIQNRKAKQSKFILKMQPANVILLSGTPCSGKYENLWSQARLLGWEIDEHTFLSHYVNFKKLYTAAGAINIVDKSNPYKNEERLKYKLRQHGAVFMKTEDVIDLPEQTLIEMKVPETKEYKKFMKDDVVTIDGIDLIGNTQLTKLLYARQLCGRFNNHKLESFRTLLESTNDRLIVFYNFNDELTELKSICEALNRPVSEVNGAVKDLDAYEKESDSVTLCQYQAASKGLNLQLANKIIYFTPTLSVENWMQSKKRIHRIGQKQKCFYYKLVSGIETKIYQAIERGVDYTNELFKEGE